MILTVRPPRHHADGIAHHARRGKGGAPAGVLLRHKLDQVESYDSRSLRESTQEGDHLPVEQPSGGGGDHGGPDRWVEPVTAERDEAGGARWGGGEDSGDPPRADLRGGDDARASGGRIG